MQLDGKNVIYVGGFGGIGEKCVEAFLKKSVKSMLIFDLNSNDEYLKYLQRTYKNSYVDYIYVDLTKPETVERAYKEAKDKIDSFDVVVNGSGLFDDNKVDLMVAINLTGLIHSSLIALEYMSKVNGGPGGCIVNISSVAGLGPTEICCVYGATKCGVTNFTRSYAKPAYFDKTGISFIVICPGATKSPMMNNIADKMALAKYTPGVRNMMANIKLQTAEACAENVIHVVETASNGTTWALEDGTIQEVTFPDVWESVITQK